jgi:hypothetical protein
MVGKRHQAWRNLMVAAVLMTGSPANANDRAVYAAYCEQVALELYNKFSAIPPSLIPAFDPDLHAAVVKEHNEILAQITREYHRFKDYADAALINDSKGNLDLNMTAARRHATQDWQACKTFTDAHVGHYDIEKRTYVQDTTPLPPECLRVRRCQGVDDPHGP